MRRARGAVHSSSWATELTSPESRARYSSSTSSSRCSRSHRSRGCRAGPGSGVPHERRAASCAEARTRRAWRTSSTAGPCARSPSGASARSTAPGSGSTASGARSTAPGSRSISRGSRSTVASIPSRPSATAVGFPAAVPRWSAVANCRCASSCSRVRSAAIPRSTWDSASTRSLSSSARPPPPDAPMHRPTAARTSAIAPAVSWSCQPMPAPAATATRSAVSASSSGVRSLPMVRSSCSVGSTPRLRIRSLAASGSRGCGHAYVEALREPQSLSSAQPNMNAPLRHACPSHPCRTVRHLTSFQRRFLLILFLPRGGFPTLGSAPRTAAASSWRCPRAPPRGPPRSLRPDRGTSPGPPRS